MPQICFCYCYFAIFIHRIYYCYCYLAIVIYRIEDSGYPCHQYVIVIVILLFIESTTAATHATDMSTETESLTLKTRKSIWWEDNMCVIIILIKIIWLLYGDKIPLLIQGKILWNHADKPFTIPWDLYCVTHVHCQVVFFIINNVSVLLIPASTLIPWFKNYPCCPDDPWGQEALPAAERLQLRPCHRWPHRQWVQVFVFKPLFDIPRDYLIK